MGLGDGLFQLAEWLRTTRLAELSVWMSNTRPSVWIGTHFWTIPILQVIHILALAAAFGSLLMINFRILGWAGGTRTMTQMVRRFLPWVWWALLVLILTGLVMIVGDPPRLLVNPIFWIKMVLVVGVILASVGFQTTVVRGVAAWETTRDGRALVRVGAVGIMLLWCAVMVAGRWIAYAPV